MGIPAGRPGYATEQRFPSVHDRRWMARLDELHRFMEAHGHANVPRRWPENPGLSHWVINQRRLLRRGALSPDRVRRLESLGVRWPTADDRERRRELHWNRLCDALHTFLRTQGHCDVPEGWRENPELARWTARQRRMLRTGTLREDRARRFEERGIDWTQEPRRSRTRDGAWNRRLWQLREYRKAHGSCDVPRNHEEIPGLGRWLSRQRFLIRRNALRPDRRRVLEELGVSPTARVTGRPPSAPVSSGRRELAWRGHYEALLRFHEAEGHSDVPRRLRSDPTLARWVSHQRELRRVGRLSRERIALLDALRFPWSGRDALDRGRDRDWERSFARLGDYRRAHGDCDVPSCWPADPSLGRWVAAQRARRHAGRLRPERIARLESIGFRWRR